MLLEQTHVLDVQVIDGVINVVMVCILPMVIVVHQHISSMEPDVLLVMILVQLVMVTVPSNVMVVN
jgi:hypothetical protein